MALDFSISFKGRYGHVTFYGPNQPLLMYGRKNKVMFAIFHGGNGFVTSAYLTNTWMNGHKSQDGRSLPGFVTAIFSGLSSVFSTYGQMINNYWKVLGGRGGNSK